jgi:PIN domain nuclease of toxin-antitoxin system
LREQLHLDTHVVAWLYAGLLHQLSDSAKTRLEQSELFVSPAVQLELTHWYEQGTILVGAHDILNDLERRIGLEVCVDRFDRIVQLSHKYPWAADTFDRLICTHAGLRDAELLTKDAHLHDHFPKAVW